MTNRMVGSVLILLSLLFNVEVAAAQTYTQMQWGMNKGVTPYQFGANINGTWSNLGTISSAGVWTIPSGNTSYTQSGAGAITTSVQNRLRKVVYADDFGADPTGNTDSLTAINNAIASLSYSTFFQSGGTIKFGRGTYCVSNSINMTGKHGLEIVGDGKQATTIKTCSGAGAYPLFVDNGTYSAPTSQISIRDMNISCGGKSVANAHGVKLTYSNNSLVTDNWFSSCNKAINLQSVWQTWVSRNRVAGGGTQQNNICLYMETASDTSDPWHNNAAIVDHNLCQNAASYGARLENATGSLFDHNQWLDGITGVYYCDPPSATFPNGDPSFCQFTFWSQDQVDTNTGAGWVFKKGLASYMGRGVYVDQPWTGNSVGYGISVNGAQGLSIVNAEIESTDQGFGIANTTDSTFTGHIYNYNRNNNGSGTVSFTGVTANNTVNISQESNGNTIVGYNGITETGTYSNNQFYAGIASCSVGLSFGGANTGMTYNVGPATANQCKYEVKGMSVEMQFYIALSAKGSSTGAAKITNLPFIAAPAVGYGYGAVGSILGASNMSGLPGAILYQVEPALQASSLVSQGAAGFANLTDANFTDTSIISGRITYMKQ